MAQQSPTSTGASLNPSRYTEQRAAQFAGGDTDPETGNLIPATRSSYTDAPLPAAPKTQLGSVEPLPTLLNTPTSSNPYQAPKGPSTTDQLGAIAGAALPSLAKAFGGGSGSSSTFDGSGRMPNAGGFSTGGGTGNGGNAGRQTDPFTLDTAPQSPPQSSGQFNPMTADIPSAPSGGQFDTAPTFDLGPTAQFSPPSAQPAPTYYAPQPTYYDYGGYDYGGGDWF